VKITLSVLGLSFAGVLSGCSPVVSVHPLYTEDEVKKPYLDQRVEGEWMTSSLDDFDENDATHKPPCHVSVSKPTKGEFPYTVEFHCPGSKAEPGETYSKYDVHLLSLGADTFFDARFAESDEKGKHISLKDIEETGVAPAHIVGEVWVQHDFVRFAPLASDWVESNWPGDFLVRSKIKQFSSVDILTNQTEDLRNLLSRNAGSPSAFGFPLFLCRAGADCDARAVADQLARTPDDGDVLEGAAKFYKKRGDFARAIGLERHKITSEKGAGKDQFELARLLLLSRDFEGARRALTTADEPTRGPSVKVLVVRSYFLQGDYAGTVRAAKSLADAKNLISADPIILSYFALHRMGKAKEAEAHLKEQVASFVGPGQEQLYLLDVSGRVTNGLETAEDKDRRTYYYALNALKSGNIEHGRGHLEDLAKRLAKDDLTGLAAQIELERLSSTTNK